MVLGVCLAAWPSHAGSAFSSVKPLYLGLILLSVFLPALATIAKEGVFTDAKKQLGRCAFTPASAHCMQLSPCYRTMMTCSAELLASCM